MGRCGGSGRLCVSSCIAMCCFHTWPMLGVCSMGVGGWVGGVGWLKWRSGKVRDLAEMGLPPASGRVWIPQISGECALSQSHRPASQPIAGALRPSKTARRGTRTYAFMHSFGSAWVCVRAAVSVSVCRRDRVGGNSKCERDERRGSNAGERFSTVYRWSDVNLKKTAPSLLIENA